MFRIFRRKNVDEDVRSDFAVLLLGCFILGALVAGWFYQHEGTQNRASNRASSSNAAPTATAKPNQTGPAG
jgi:hypothetical protein